MAAWRRASFSIEWSLSTGNGMATAARRAELRQLQAGRREIASKCVVVTTGNGGRASSGGCRVGLSVGGKMARRCQQLPSCLGCCRRRRGASRQAGRQQRERRRRNNDQQRSFLLYILRTTTIHRFLFRRIVPATCADAAALFMHDYDRINALDPPAQRESSPPCVH